MSTVSNILGKFGFKTGNIDEYQKRTLAVIEEAIKVEKLLKVYIDQQRVFTDSLVEWTGRNSLSDLAGILSQMNFEWTKSQEVFRESITRVRHEFEVIATDLGDQEYFETRHESAKKEVESHKKEVESHKERPGKRVSEADGMKLIERERRKRRHLADYLANRENQTMVRVKRSLNNLAHGFMHQGACSFNIYQAFQTALMNILPDHLYDLRPIILKPDDYLAISEGRAESSLAVERAVSRSRACSLGQSERSCACSLGQREERRQDRWATRPAPLLPPTSVTEVDSSEDRDKVWRKNKEAVQGEARNESKDGNETGREGKKKGRKGRRKGTLSATRTELDGVSVEESPSETQSPSIDKVSGFSSPPQPRSLKEETLEKPETPTSVSASETSTSVSETPTSVSEIPTSVSGIPTSVSASETSTSVSGIPTSVSETPTSVSGIPTSDSGTIRSSLGNQSVPVSEGFEVSNNSTSGSEKTEEHEPVHELIHTTHPAEDGTDELVK